MTMEISRPTLAVAHAYKETPGVKKLAKGYKLLPKEVLPQLIEDMFASIMFTILGSCLVAGAALGLTLIFSLSVVWAFVITGLFAIFCVTKLAKPPISWLLNAPDSPIVINKEHRAKLKKTRLLAAQLGESVVPVLTEAHVAAITHVYDALALATGETGSQDYDRFGVLILEDLNREPLLLDIITNRGITTMSGVEAALQDIESTLTSPVQSGWL